MFSFEMIREEHDIVLGVLPDEVFTEREIKLNPGDVDDAAVNLKKVAAIFKHNPPTSLSVVVGKSGIAHRREDGVYVLPITSLRP